MKNLDRTGIKCIFFGYNTSYKSYKVYIKEESCIEVSRDVIFSESIAYNNSKDIPIDCNEEEEHIFTNEEVSRKEKAIEPTTNYEDNEGPSELVQQIFIPGTRKSPTWLRSTLQEVIHHETIKGRFRERNKPNRYSGYIAYMTKPTEVELTSYEKEVKHEEWKNVMKE